MGDPDRTGQQRRGLPSPAARHRPDLRPAPAGAGPDHRGPARRRAVAPLPADPALPLLAAGDHHAHERGGRSRAGDAGGGLADADRPAGRDRHASGRGMPPSPGRRRPERRDARHPRLQVRQVPPTVPPPDRGRRAARLPAGPRPHVPSAAGRHVPGQQPRRAAGRAQHPAHVRRVDRVGGHCGPAGTARPEAARPAAHIHRRDPAGVVPGRRERAGPPPAAVDLARPHRPEVDLLVPPSRPRTSRSRGRQARTGGRAPRWAGGPVTDLAPLLQGFFTDRLARQKNASPHTVAAYRDTYRLLLVFVREQTGKAPNTLSLADLDATLIAAFLQHLEQQRGNGSATRNARLAAIHSLFRYAAPRAPEHAAVISQVLAIPPRRRERAIVSYLTPTETDALLAGPDRVAWHGRRDHALLLLAVQTGLRVSELTALSRQDTHLGAGPHVRCHGKGRKDRAPRSPARPSRCSEPGSPSSAPPPTARCSPPGPEAGSPETPSSGSSPST